MSKKPKRAEATLETAKIGFIGCGKISQALINGFVVYGKIEPKRIYVTAPSQSNTDTMKAAHKGLKTSKRNIDVFGRFDCDIIFLCVPPNVIRNLYKMGGTKPAALTTNYIPNMRHPIYILSLVFGFSCNQIKECLLNPDNPGKYKAKFHRIVMSSAASYGLSHCWIDVEPDSTKMSDLIRNVVGTISKFEYLPENLMDSACTIVGAGITFCYYFINAMSDGALKVGLTRASAIKFTAKVAAVSAQTLLETGKTAGQLKDECCSPSGGAIYGISVLDKSEVSAGISNAVESAFKRAQQMAQTGNID